MVAGAAAPWTRTGTCEMRKAKPESVSWPRKSRQPSVSGLATRPTCSGSSGTGRVALRRSRPSASSARSSLVRCRGDAAEQGGDVDVGEDEAELALGPIQIERAPQHDDHALGELDALFPQRVAQRDPRRAPALDLERRLAAPAAGAAGSGVLVGIDQIEVEMAGAVVGDVLDFAADPQVPAPGEGLGERRLDLVVETRNERTPGRSAAGAEVRASGGVSASVPDPVTWGSMDSGCRASGSKSCVGALGHCGPRYRDGVPSLLGRRLRAIAVVATR